MYRVVYAQRRDVTTAINEVAQQVNYFKKDGWILSGGISVSSVGIDGFYVVAQSMIKNED